MVLLAITLLVHVIDYYHRAASEYQPYYYYDDGYNPNEYIPKEEYTPIDFVSHYLHVAKYGVLSLVGFVMNLIWAYRLSPNAEQNRKKPICCQCCQCAEESSENNKKPFERYTYESSALINQLSNQK